MDLVRLDNKKKIFHHFINQAYLQIYSIADLDDYYWKDSEFYGWIEQGELKLVILLHYSFDIPILSILTENNSFDISRMFISLQEKIPQRVYASFTPGIKTIFRDHYDLESKGDYFKMGLVDPSRLDMINISEVVGLSGPDELQIMKLYELSYPNNWFLPRMLDHGHFYGLKNGAELISIGGTHVYSSQYKVATIGNVATHPQLRGQGLAVKVIAAVCKSLLQSVKYVGLNVKADNLGAIKIYEKLGFGITHCYEEIVMVKR